MIERSPPPENQALSAFVGARAKLFGIAYRMLGSVAEAEDVVQEAWVRWQSADREAVLDPEGFLVTMTTRLSINVVQSARMRRETYVGPWLPEPVDTRLDPELGAVRRAALELAVLVLLEKLTPAERAAYVLREAFDYPYERIGEILELTEPNVRQHVSRARKHLTGAGERRAQVRDGDPQKLLEAFVTAAQLGDGAALERLFAADVTSITDGGGVARQAARAPVVGRAQVAKFLAGFAARFWADTTLTWLETNGRPSVLVSRGDAPIALATIEASAGGIDRIFWVMSPSKLARVPRA